GIAAARALDLRPGDRYRNQPSRRQLKERKPMIDALHIAASGLRSEQKLLEVISNNVANLQTPGFKRSRVNFVDVASAAVAAGQEGDAGAHRVDGIRIASISAEFSAGDMRATGSALDLAIDGIGFFELATADGGVVYTRDG